MADAPASPGAAGLPPGTKVEVRERFSGSWTRGFIVETNTGDGYTLTRRSDGEVLPGTFAAADVRRERKSMWWV
jgi:hypothetical protein